LTYCIFTKITTKVVHFIFLLKYNYISETKFLPYRSSGSNCICSMKNIFIEQTSKTPKVEFNAETGVLLIEGISIPENTVEFYHTLIYWINEYSQNPLPETTLVLKLEYFNTSTSVVLLNMFKILSDIDGTEVKVDWYYESDDIEMEEVGKDYANMINIPFKLIAVDVF